MSTHTASGEQLCVNDVCIGNLLYQPKGETVSLRSFALAVTVSVLSNKGYKKDIFGISVV